MSSEVFDFFTCIFEGKTNDTSNQNTKTIIEQNVQQYEDETIKLSNKYFEIWAQNLLHLTNEILFDTTVHYFSIFTKVIDVIPSFFPEDSQIFLLIVQSFLNNIIQNDELMKNFRLSFCRKIQILICSNNNSIDYSQIDLILTICKSLHITDTLCEEIYQYPFNFTENINFDPCKQVQSYVELSFSRFILAEQLLYHILNQSTNQIKSTQFLNNIIHTLFNQLITSKMHSLTFNVNPPIGKVLATPFLSWISDEFTIQRNKQKSDKNDTTNYKFKQSQLYEACSSFIYDEILKFTRDKNDDIGNLLYMIENLSFHYSRAFENVPGAMNFLESSIREALNDSRLKFAYNLALYLDSLMNDTFINGSNFWENLVAVPEKEEEKNKGKNCGCGCGCEFMLQKSESLGKSSLLRAVMRIENKSKLCDYFTDSLNSLASQHGPAFIQAVARPVIEIVQLATNGSVTNFSVVQQKGEDGGNSNQGHAHSCSCHHDHGEEQQQQKQEAADNSNENEQSNHDTDHNHSCTCHHETANSSNENGHHDDHSHSCSCHHHSDEQNQSHEKDVNGHLEQSGQTEDSQAHSDHSHSCSCHHDHDDSNCHHDHCGSCCCSDQPSSTSVYVEASIQVGSKSVPVFCDYMTFQVLSEVSKGGVTLEDIEKAVDGKTADIENRVFTLAEYLIIEDDEGCYTIDESYVPEDGFIRIPPFFEAMKGELEFDRHKIVRQKMTAAIQTKESESLDFFITDCFVMLNRKVRPDTSMILDMLDELVQDGVVTFENDVVTYVENKEEEKNSEDDNNNNNNVVDDENL